MSTEKKKSVALSSVFASFALTAGKLVVGILTGSMGIISEAAHSGLDLCAALLTYFTVRVSDKPADEKLHYGYAKMESVSALIETGLLFLTSAWIIYEAIRRMIGGKTEVEATWYAFAVVLFSIIVDISRSRALNKVAKETKSQALEADALHFSSDVYSSLVVLVGLVFVYFGINGADSIAAIGVSIFVLVAGYRLGKRTIDVLIDAAPHGLDEKIREIIKNIKDVIAIERIRIRPMGASVSIDMILKINRRLPLEKVNEITAKIEEEIRKKIPESDVVIHTHSVQLDNETIIETMQVIAAKNSLYIHDIAIESLKKQKFLSYDLEVADTLSVGESHRIASKLENEIKEELGSEFEISTHIEPLRATIISSSLAEKSEAEEIENKIKKIAEKIPLMDKIHNVSIRKMDDKFFITLHCFVDAKTPLEKAHEAASKLEYLARESHPEIKKIMVHVEPAR